MVIVMYIPFFILVKFIFLIRLPPNSQLLNLYFLKSDDLSSPYIYYLMRNINFWNRIEGERGTVKVARGTVKVERGTAKVARGTVKIARGTAKVERCPVKIVQGY